MQHFVPWAQFLYGGRTPGRRHRGAGGEALVDDDDRDRAHAVGVLEDALDAGDCDLVSGLFLAQARREHADADAWQHGREAV